jgi:hypothetical protein
MNLQDTSSLVIVLPDTSEQVSDEPDFSYIDTSFRFKDIINMPRLQSVDTSRMQYETLFGEHHLKPENSLPVAVSRDTPDWLFFVLMLIIALLTWLKVFYRKNILQIFEAFFSNVVANQIVRDENILVQRASVLLTITFNLAAALLLYMLSEIYDWPVPYAGSGFSKFIIFALVISFAYTAKFIVLKIAGFLFRIDKAIATYIFNIFIINNVLGILLILLVIGIAYLPSTASVYLIPAAAILVCFAYIYRFLRGLVIGFSYNSYSNLYLFLYLCALEIAPLLIIIKLIA